MCSSEMTLCLISGGCLCAWQLPVVSVCPYMTVKIVCVQQEIFALKKDLTMFIKWEY